MLRKKICNQMCRFTICQFENQKKKHNRSNQNENKRKSTNMYEYVSRKVSMQCLLCGVRFWILAMTTRPYIRAISYCSEKMVWGTVMKIFIKYSLLFFLGQVFLLPLLVSRQLSSKMINWSILYKSSLFVRLMEHHFYF